MTETDERRAQRLSKMERLRELGIDPFPPRACLTHTAAQALAAHVPDAEQQPTVTVAGRLVSVRVMGKSTFAHLRDSSGAIQIYLQRDVLGESSYDVFRQQVDLGDFCQCTGELFVTRTGEITVRVTAWTFLGKALRPLPEKWHGLRDTETRYRQRYLDLLANDEVRDVFVKRTRIISAVRRFLDGRGCLEVETPTLQPIYGGANARPFTTYHNELERTLYLRIADELYLKRLLVGGFERVYEIAKDFRNEGIDRNHSPEFTMLEFYEAYADYEIMMDTVEALIVHVVTAVTGEPRFTFQGHEIDVTPPWPRKTLRQAIIDGSGVDYTAHPTQPELLKAARDAGADVDSDTVDITATGTVAAPTSGAPGTLIVVTTSCWPHPDHPNLATAIAALVTHPGGSVVATATVDNANGTGNAVLTLTVPPGTAPGGYRITTSCDTYFGSVQYPPVDFTVT